MSISRFMKGELAAKSPGENETLKGMSRFSMVV
jgi:hypothetical protein